MNLTRRQLLKNGLLLGGFAPFSIGAAWASQLSSGIASRHGEIGLYGSGSSATKLGLGLRQQGWTPRYEGHLDPLSLNSLPSGALVTGFTDEAGLVLLTSLLAGRGRILALGRHEARGDYLVSHRGPVTHLQATEGESWQFALGEAYARLALAGTAGRYARRFPRLEIVTDKGSELSFLVRL
ncbi:hypothetical protein [Modicisalibacter xianhensis]|uniref:Uncharacterized protein n=1 Tax=Modicisalibacter xianhensis TaxID=442341 RepID=A0A1I3FYS0_9GAMM|nr:hypothetical protein [Halomonas xianhensis]SFI16334.1 hypothetical protein SAMN04487959_12310 [Halomonas xianhensis]